MGSSDSVDCHMVDLCTWRITEPLLAGLSGLTLPSSTGGFVNGFVNETRHNCPYGMGRGVMAWTPD